MPERQVAKNLQLDEATGRSSSHLELQETGKQVDSRWQLQNESGLNQWQPVEYARPSQSESNWILPSLVGLVLISVAGYMVYIGLNRLSSLDLASVSVDPAPLAENSDVTAADSSAPVESAVQQEATDTPAPTEEPTATAVPTEEPTPEPTAVLVEQQIATISNQFGVNARLEPSTTSEVLRILEEGETVVILDEQESDEIDGTWLQVRTSEDATVWISSQFVDIETQVVAGEPELGAEVIPDLDVRVTISSPAGLNARAEPDASSEIVALLPDATSYQAVSQSEDSQWIEVALDDGATAWIFLQLVIPNTDLGALPIFQDEASTSAADDEATDEQQAAEDETVIEPEAETVGEAEGGGEETPADETDEGDLAADSPAADTGVDTGVDTATEDVAATETLTDTVEDDSTTADLPADATTDTPVDDAPVDTGQVITITNQFGVNARSTTSTDGEILVVLEPDSLLPLRGRNDDGSWLQVVLDGGQLAWVFTQAVEAPEDIEDVPVYTPPAVGVPAETLDSAAPAEEAPADDGIPETTENTATEEAAAPDEGATEEESPTDDESSSEGGVDSSDGTAGDAVIATVTSFLGADARPAPTTEEEPIDTVPIDTALTVLGRSDDNEWIQVELFENEAAWLLTSKVELSIPIDDVPVIE